MITSPKFRLQTTVLALTNVSLLLLLAYIWNAGQRRVQEPQHLSARAVADLDLAVLTASLNPPINVAGIRDQAVFYSRRAFYEAPQPSQSIPAPEFDLAGTMSLPQGKRVAFVKKRIDQTSRTLHIGDDLEGWRVDRIDAALVLLVRDQQHAELHSTAGSSGSGLIHATDSAPAASPLGVRVLGAQGSHGSAGLSTASTQARTYRPPPR